MRRSHFLPFSRPAISEEEIGRIADVLRSGWITTGRRAAEFEDAFGRYVGCRHAVALSSATAGMHLALIALGIGPGDEVITPSLTWVSTVNLIVLTGAVPVFADVDPETLMVTPDTIRAVLSERTRAILPVHFAGAPVELEPLRRLAAERDLALIEDAAHAAGTAYRGTRIGAQGTAIFSFHPIKNMTTGEGGMFCSDDDELAERIRRLKFHGLGVDAYSRHTQGRAPQAEVIEPGFKYNMTDISAMLGLGQLERLAAFNARRAELAAYYAQRLADVEELLPLGAPPYPIEHARHLFVVRLDIDKAVLGRDEFMARLSALNIGTGLHFRAVHLQKYYREQMGFQRGLLPATEWNSDRILSLPLFPAMTDEDVDDVVEAAKTVLLEGARREGGHPS